MSNKTKLQIGGENKNMVLTQLESALIAAKAVQVGNHSFMIGVVNDDKTYYVEVKLTAKGEDYSPEDDHEEHLRKTAVNEEKAAKKAAKIKQEIAKAEEKRKAAEAKAAELGNKGVDKN